MAVGIMISPTKNKGGAPPPTFGKKAPDPMMDAPDDEAGEASGMKRIEDKLDKIIAAMGIDDAGQGDPSMDAAPPMGGAA